MGARRTIPVGVTAGVLMLAVAGGALSGCARARERWKARFNPPEPEPAGLLSQEEAAESDRGLEIAVWTADDTGFGVGRVLAELATPAAPAPDHEAWAAAGLRLLAVPSDRVDELLRRAPPVGAVQRQRYAQLPIWTPLVRGPRLPAGVSGPGGRAVPVGRPRLIARAWAEPDLSSGTLNAVLRTELTIQIENAGLGSFSPDLSGPRTIATDGPILERLLTALISDGSTAFVIVAESPAVDWDELPPLPTPPAPGERLDPDAPPGPNPPAVEPGGPAATPATDPTPGAAPGPAGGPGAFGPVITGERTLGERMLASPGVRSIDGRPAIGPRKVLLVLMPRLPDADAGREPLSSIQQPTSPRAAGVREEPS